MKNSDGKRMRRFLPIFIILSFLAGCGTTPVTPQVHEDVIEITELNPNRLTGLTKQNLFHLAKVYDLRPFLYTKKIQIQSFIVPHSHPVLTLNTRHAEKPHQLLSTWLHEEFHWWTEGKKAETNKAITELKKLYPKIDGKIGNQSSYIHIIVCFLEYQSLKHFLGEKDAKEVIDEFISQDKIYPWIYSLVLQKTDAISRIIRKNKLIPAPLI